MNIGFLGAGRMTEALAPLWTAAGHDVVIGGRTAEKATAIAERAGARVAPLDEGWRDADVVVLSVLYQGVTWTLEAAGVTGGALTGKVLIDVNNPVEVDEFQVVEDFQPSLAEHLAATTGADVVKALNQVEATVWSTRATFGGAPLVVPVATDSDRARGLTEQLVRDAGAVPVDAGPLLQARNLEAMTAVIIRHLWTGGQSLSAFQLTVGQAAVGGAP